MACESVNDVLMVSYSYCERQKYSPDVIKKTNCQKRKQSLSNLIPLPVKINKYSIHMYYALEHFVASQHSAPRLSVTPLTAAVK